MYTQTGVCMHTHPPSKAAKHTRIKHWLRLHFPMQKVQVQSLVGELRATVPQCQKTKTLKKKKQKQYCNKFNKDLKNDPHQRNLF